ncbi:uncharacterized protein LOC135155287 [Lytechinus pictus]|uniref:uncharacterized protein LOC135155287 n=1 Tax=Lytechinus pictus TaxID=7653 RepID=UPI0030B9BFBC
MSEFNSESHTSTTHLRAHHDHGILNKSTGSSPMEQIAQCRKETNAHLESMRSDIDSKVFEDMKWAKDREREEEARIDEEIDEKNQKLEQMIASHGCMMGKSIRFRKINREIIKNNNDRKLRHTRNKETTQIIQDRIANRQLELQSEIEAIAEEIERKLCELEKSWQCDTKGKEDRVQDRGELPTSDENVKDVQAKGAEGNGAPDDKLNRDSLDTINRIIADLKLTTFDRRGYCGRIDGYEGEWSLVDTIKVTDKVKDPSIIGHIDELVIISSTNDDVFGCDTFSFDVRTKQSQKVLTSEGSRWTVSCALLNDDNIVCGNYYENEKDFKGDTLSELVRIYDRQWNLIKSDFSIPRKGVKFFTWAEVDVCQNGMIIVEHGRDPTNVYIMNPSDGRIDCSIPIKDMMMRGVLFTGHIVSHNLPANRKLFKVNRQGSQTEIPLWEFPRQDDICNICIDHLNDALYVVSSDPGYHYGNIDQMTDDEEKKKRVGSFLILQDLPMHNRKRLLNGSKVIVTSSGKVIACDGENILVFQNKLKL